MNNPSLEQDRIAALNPDIIVGLARLSIDPLNENDIEEQLASDLPRGLTVEEVNALGSRISNVAESIAPSRDGLVGGLHAERLALYVVALVSEDGGDHETTNSVLRHIKSGGLCNALTHVILKRTIQKRRSGNVNNPLQTG